VEIDRNGLEILERETCMRLLATAAFGRIAIHVDALPVIIPVNYVATDRGIVVRTASGAKLEHATDQAVVAFEVDAIDPIFHTGWSVAVTGMAHRLSSVDDLEWGATLAVPHWTPNRTTDHLICISTQIVSGRRLGSVSVRHVELTP
jgi:nitroimidazol reductase NimA-like FMN-containing flavoprotein (pyridoxamine 5'-phosphate oxidase superfamily)